MKINYKLLSGILVLAGVSVLMYAFLRINGWEPSGFDVWGHIFKSQEMYDGIGKGNLYPLYSEKWYNGIQLYRYWPPLVYYIMSLFIFLAGGNIIFAYYMFAAFVIFVGGLPFVLLGKHLNRPVMGTVCAILWFALPDNIRVFFIEGNMPRIMTSVVIPYVMYFLWRYIRENKKSSIIGLMLSMTFLTFTHLMLTAITGIGTFLFLLFDIFKNRNVKRDIEALAAMVIGIFIAGIWFVPAMFGGMLSMGDSSSQTQDLLTYSLKDSLNFMNRVSGEAGFYYFGLSVLFVALFGIVLANKSKAGFFLAVVVLLGTTPATVAVTKHLPLGEFLWMTRFTALAYAFFMLSLLEWKTLRKKYAILLMLLLIADSGVSLVYLPRYYVPVNSDAKYDGALLKEKTTQRASVIDLSSYGCYLSWSLVYGDDGVDYTFGWAWQGAVTAQNIMLVNEAFEHEEYNYVFDRSIELGDDTVLIKKELVKDAEKMYAAAKQCGYEPVSETDGGYLFKKDTPRCFGVKTEYTGLAIGRYAITTTVFYPSFMIGKSDFVDEYTLDELTGYETVFLSGFKYHNQDKAEQLLRAASEKGVRIVIDCAHIPENGLKQKSFLGVRQSDISFKDNFPDLVYDGDVIISGNVPTEDGIWKTGYADHIDNVIGYIEADGNEIPFFGYNDSEENIYFLGLNLAYFAENADNDELWEILNNCFLLNYNQVPERELIPLKITFGNNKIIIDSEQEHVNTTLAFQDNFVSKQSIYSENNLLIVDEKHTEIDIVYPHFALGLATSVIGVLLGVGMIVIKNHKKHQDEA